MHMHGVDLVLKGKIISAQDQGTIWQLFYRRYRDGIGIVTFDHRPFADFYQAATGRDFFRDYAMGAGRDYISKRLRGLRIRVNGEPYQETICLEESVR
jgi:hypothetical protein